MEEDEVIAVIAVGIVLILSWVIAGFLFVMLV
jgi:hypothetical protein